MEQVRGLQSDSVWGWVLEGRMTTHGNLFQPGAAATRASLFQRRPTRDTYITTWTAAAEHTCKTRQCNTLMRVCADRRTAGA